MTGDAAPEFARGWLSRVPEYLAALGVLTLVPITYQGWQVLPARIPTHFNAAGLPDGWGPKWTLYLLAGAAVAMYLGISAVQRFFPHRLNSVVRITVENRARQQRLALGLVRWLKAEVVALFAFLLWSTVQVGAGEAERLSPAAAWSLVAALLGTVLLFSLWMIRER